MRAVRKLTVCCILFSLALLFSLYGEIALHWRVREEEQIVETVEEEIIEIVPLIETVEEEEIEEVQPTNEVIEELREIKRRLGEVTLTCTRLVLVNEYRVFITAYCAEECGWNYWTSTDTYCHRSTHFNRYEPTTCAIDPNYFSYGTMFYIPSEDRVYIAEDTGLTRGMWIDTYQDDMSDVESYNTRYETVYTVVLEYYTVNSSIYHVQDIINDYQRNSI